MASGWKVTAATALSLLLIGGLSTVQAEINPAKLQASKTAASEFASLAKGSEKTGNAPRASDPKVKKLLDAIYDDSDVVGSKSTSFDEMKPLSDRMIAGVQTAIVYMLAGTGVSDLAEIGKVPEGEVKVNLNIIKFGPEMGRFYDFQLHVQGAIADAVATKLATGSRLELAKPNFQSGLAQIRQGGQRVVAGVIETLAVNGITDDWRRDRIPALMDSASSMGKILEPEQKKQLQELARACADVMDDAAVKKGLQDFAVKIGG